jgi:hypothetical protein
MGIMSYKCEMCDNWATRWALCDHCYAYMNHPSYQSTLKEYKVHDETVLPRRPRNDLSR